MGWDKVLTETQKQALMSEAAREGAELLNAPAVKDIIKPVVIGRYGSEFSRGHFGSLVLSREGLRVKEGYNDPMPSGDFENGSYSGRPIVVNETDLKGVVEKFKLTPEKIREIREAIERQ